MKSRAFPALAVFGGAALLLLAAPRPSSGQFEPAASPELTALVNDLAVQTRQLTENQKLIDERVAQIAEKVRQARLFAARAGRGGAAPK